MVNEVEADFAVQPATHEVGSELPQAVMDFASPPPFPPKQCPRREINVNKSDPGKRFPGEGSLDSLAPFSLSKHPHVLEPRSLPCRVPAHPGFGTLTGFAGIGGDEHPHSYPLRKVPSNRVSPAGRAVYSPMVFNMTKLCGDTVPRKYPPSARAISACFHRSRTFFAGPMYSETSFGLSPRFSTA